MKTCCSLSFSVRVFLRQQLNSFISRGRNSGSSTISLLFLDNFSFLFKKQLSSVSKLVNKKMMNATSFITDPSTSSVSPCSPNEVALDPGDCVEGGVEEWLEDEALAGFRVWQLAGIVLSIILALIIGLCCCIKFRIPRTKQDIEADYIRKKITKSFHKELDKIDNTDMDEMDLRKALERVRTGLEVENEELQKHHQSEVNGGKLSEGLGETLQAIVHGMRIRFARSANTLPKNRSQEQTDCEA